MHAYLTGQDRQLRHESIIDQACVRSSIVICPITLQRERLLVLQRRVLRRRGSTSVAHSRDRVRAVDSFAKGEHHAPFVAVLEDVRDLCADLEPEFVDRHLRRLAVGVRGARDYALGARVAPELAVEVIILPVESLLDRVV